MRCLMMKSGSDNSRLSSIRATMKRAKAEEIPTIVREPTPDVSEFFGSELMCDASAICIAA